MVQLFADLFLLWVWFFNLFLIEIMIFVLIVGKFRFYQTVELIAAFINCLDIYCLQLCWLFAWNLGMIFLKWFYILFIILIKLNFILNTFKQFLVTVFNIVKTTLSKINSWLMNQLFNGRLLMYNAFNVLYILNVLFLCMTYRSPIHMYFIKIGQWVFFCRQLITHNMNIKPNSIPYTLSTFIRYFIVFVQFALNRHVRITPKLFNNVMANSLIFENLLFFIEMKFEVKVVLLCNQLVKFAFSNEELSFNLVKKFDLFILVNNWCDSKHFNKVKKLKTLNVKGKPRNR